MVLVSYSGREINAKLVYYGPGLSGKTTNLEYIYGSIPQGQRGKMVSMKTKTERTLFFDFLPVNLGELSGFKTRFLLYTVPGQVYYNATRKLVLKGVDAVVFVADSKRGKMDENLESLENLRQNLLEQGVDLDTIQWVMQYNKRDLPDVYTIDELEEVLNPGKVPVFEAVAMNGQGVVDTFKGVSRLLLRKLAKDIGAPAADRPPASTDAPPAPPPAAQPTVVSRPDPAPPSQVEQCADQEEPPVPVGDPSPGSDGPNEERCSSSVGDRLRRWLSRPHDLPGAGESPSEGSSAEPPGQVSPDLPPEVETAQHPEPRAMSQDHDPQPAGPADPQQTPVPQSAIHGPSMEDPPKAARQPRRARPREVLVPLELSPRDLETGIVLKLVLQMQQQGYADDGPEEEDTEAA